MKLGNTGYHGLIINGHGGSCCGINHIWDFPAGYSFSATIAEKVEFIRQAVSNCLRQYADNRDRFYGEFDEDKWHMAIEVVLVSGQLSTWQEALLEVGFTRIYEFPNSNSGNTCYIFMLTTGDRK